MYPRLKAQLCLGNAPFPHFELNLGSYFFWGKMRHGYAFSFAFFALFATVKFMMQVTSISTPTGEKIVSMPGPSREMLPGIVWGRFDQLFTPAFWCLRAECAEVHNLYASHELGANLVEEVAACILGGFGMPAEMGIAAFNRLKDRKLISSGSSPEMIEKALLEPLFIRGRSMRYRYPQQKSRYLASALVRLDLEEPPVGCPVLFRNWLASFQGIGLKTASWITRNHLGSDEVAVLDIHIIRAGILAGLYSASEKVEKSYLIMEQKLIAFAKSLGVKLSFLDALIWDEMRQLSWLACQILADTSLSQPKIIP